MGNIIEVTGLKKTYTSRGHETPALRGINFTVEKGEIFGILGVNGAGKSTTLSILMGLLSSSSGQIKVLGLDFAKHDSEIKDRMNVATPYADLAMAISVYRNLKIYAVMYHVKNYEKKIKQLAEQFEVTELLGSKFGELSAGQKTRVNLCKSLINDPEILLLDEPTASLDPAIAARTRELLLNAQAKHRRTILLTSHNMSEVEQMCDRVALLHKGEIYMTGTPHEIIRAHDQPGLEEIFIRLAKGEYDED